MRKFTKIAGLKRCMQVDVSLNVCFLCAFGLTALKHNSVSFRVIKALELSASTFS